MCDQNLKTLKRKKLYFANFEFISGEYGQPFVKLFYAKGVRNLRKQIHEYLIDYYGAGNTSEIDENYYFYRFGEVAVKQYGWEEITDLRQLADRLLYSR